MGEPADIAMVNRVLAQKAGVSRQDAEEASEKLSVEPPKAIERDYRRELFQRLEQAHKLVIERIQRALDEEGLRESMLRRAEQEETGSQEEEREDATEDGDVATVEAAIRETRVAYFGVDRTKGAEDLADEIGSRVSDQNKEVLQDSFKEVLGVDPVMEDEGLEQVLDDFSGRNLDLIKDMEAQYFDDVRSELVGALRKGKRPDALEPMLQERLGVGKSRAKLIARDQLATLNSQLNRQRQTELGINRYRWQTAGDERVRPSHRAKDGEVFSWSNPPADTGHPGDDIQCRCTAIPLVEDALDQMREEDAEEYGSSLSNPDAINPSTMPRAELKQRRNAAKRIISKVQSSGPSGGLTKADLSRAHKLMALMRKELKQRAEESVSKKLAGKAGSEVLDLDDVADVSQGEISGLQQALKKQLRSSSGDSELADNLEQSLRSTRAESAIRRAARGAEGDVSVGDVRAAVQGDTDLPAGVNTSSLVDDLKNIEGFEDAADQLETTTLTSNDIIDRVTTPKENPIEGSKEVLDLPARKETITNAEARLVSKVQSGSLSSTEQFKQSVAASRLRGRMALDAIKERAESLGAEDPEAVFDLLGDGLSGSINREDINQALAGLGDKQRRELIDILDYQAKRLKSLPQTDGRWEDLLDDVAPRAVAPEGDADKLAGQLRPGLDDRELKKVERVLPTGEDVDASERIQAVVDKWKSGDYSKARFVGERLNDDELNAVIEGIEDSIDVDVLRGTDNPLASVSDLYHEKRAREIARGVDSDALLTRMREGASENELREVMREQDFTQDQLSVAAQAGERHYRDIKRLSERYDVDEEWIRRDITKGGTLDESVKQAAVKEHWRKHTDLPEPADRDFISRISDSSSEVISPSKDWTREQYEAYVQERWTIGGPEVARLKELAEDTFDIDGYTPNINEEFLESKNLSKDYLAANFDEHKEEFDQALKDMYERTQAELELMEQDNVHLMRGINGERHSASTVASWTDDEKIAERFSLSDSGQVIEGNIDSERIMAYHRGVHYTATNEYEKEWVVLSEEPNL